MSFRQRTAAIPEMDPEEMAALLAWLDPERLIERALAAGQDLMRRPRDDPRAILGVRAAARSASRAA